MFDVSGYLRDLTPRGWTLLAALSFGLGAVVTSVVASVMLVTMFPPGAAIALGIFLAPWAGVGGFAVGGISWWFGVEVRHSASTNTGVYVGGATGLLAHFVMWPVSNIGWYAEIWEPYTLLDFARYVAADVVLLGLLSALLTGVVTVPAGGYIGWHLVRLRRSSDENTAEGGGE